MLFTRTTYLGIDPTAGQRPAVYAALDDDLRLLALGEGSLDDVLAFAAGQRQAVAAISAPAAPNLGLLAQDDFRAALDPPPNPGRYRDFRVAEYALRRANITIPRTPAHAAAAPRWMQMGFQLFRRLAELGYARYPAAADKQVLEVYPHAAFTVMIEQAPLPKASLEGRLQRQLILYDRKLHLPDPMDFFEEITRHRLLRGILPTTELYSPEELDALLAAYIAWLVIHQPQDITCVGDAREGQIVLPCAALKPQY